MTRSNLLPMPPVSSSRFRYSGGVLSAFESDLRDRPFDGTYPWLRPIYNDACDIGIAISSARTGRVERFYLTKTETRDGDLLAWHFAPCDKKCPVREVVIFND